MKLKPSAYLILGMLRSGVETGYAIKRAVDLSTRFFWAASLAQVYPELASLAEDGFVESRDEPRGSRPRKVYRLTDKGTRALDGWLQSERVPGFEFRDEGMLRLFFADGLSGGEARRLVARLREHAEALDRSFRDEIMPIAESTPDPGVRFPLIVARWGRDYYSWRAGWLRDLEAELAASRNDENRRR